MKSCSLNLALRLDSLHFSALTLTIPSSRVTMRDNVRCEIRYAGFREELAVTA
jgi:hypothetical protein